MLALDNAVEGCVRESYAALLAAHQQHAARDPQVRRTYARIARDEARHALFSLALHDALAARTTPEEQRTVEAAREEAVASVAHAAAVEPGESLRWALGLPDAERAVALALSLAPRVRA
jgi:rubrerythrin